MKHRWKDRREPGFTLLELILAMIVMGVIGAAVTPVIVASTDSYATARSLANHSQAAQFAIDRVIRCLREAPAGTTTRLSLETSSGTVLEFTDGNGIQLNGTTLELITPLGNAPIARDVTELTIEYIDDDGITVVDDPANAHRIRVTFAIDSHSLVLIAFPRVNVGSVL